MCSSHVLLSLPRLLLPSTMMHLILLIGASWVFLCTCPNHLNLFSRIFAKKGATPNFSLNSWFLILSIIVTTHPPQHTHFYYLHPLFENLLYRPTFCPIQQRQPNCNAVKLTFLTLRELFITKHPGCCSPLKLTRLYTIINVSMISLLL